MIRKGHTKRLFILPRGPYEEAFPLRRGPNEEAFACRATSHDGPPPRPPAFNWTLFRLAIRSSTALASHETVLGSAVPSPATPPAPCCFQIIRSGLQQVRFLRKLMPGEGFYMNVLWCIIKAWKRCAVPAAIASCCHESICAFVASRPALTRY